MGFDDRRMKHLILGLDVNGGMEPCVIPYGK